MKTILKIICWVIISPVLLSCGLLGFGAIACGLMYGYATDFRDGLGYTLACCAGEIMWLLFLVSLLPKG